ncbi:MAG TPA: hypothetical protein VGQ91_15385 [Ideonella sp.]|nr:hypothetical protein [Ideonella sp.]
MPRHPRSPIQLGVPALLALAAAFGCTAKAPVSERVGAAVRQGEVADLAKLAGFGWDKAFVFSPFSTRERICKTVSARWPDCQAAVPRVVDEGTYLLVFANQGAVVHHELHPRAHGDFCSTSCALELSPSGAVFKAVADGKLADGSPHYALYRSVPGLK